MILWIKVSLVAVTFLSKTIVAYGPSSVSNEEDDGVVGMGVGAVRYLDQYNSYII